MKRIKLSLIMIVALLAAYISPIETSAVQLESDKAIIVYGANLSDAQRNEVKEIFEYDSLGETKELVVTGKDIAHYINGDPNSNMYSSAKIIGRDKGHGIVVNILTASNITKVTGDMYKNAMLTAGVEDADVEIASPIQVTGTSALSGIYKAYDDAGAKLDDGRMEVANDELDVATDLAEKEGMDEQKVSELLAEIKQAIAEQNPATREDVEEIVSEQLNKLEISLSEEDRQLLVDLFEKMRDLDIDFGKVKDQLGDLASKIKDKVKDSDIQIDEGFWEKVKNFFSDMIDKIASFFK